MSSSTDQVPPGHPRIAPVSDPTDEQSEILGKTKMEDGPPANVFATMAHSPKLLKRFNVLGGYFMGHGQLPSRLRELSILRTAHRTACLYEFAQHRGIALRSSLLDQTEIAHVVTDAKETWAEQELAIIEATDELCAVPCLSSTMWQRLESFLDTQQLMELTLLVGFYRGLAGFINSIGVQVDDHFEGPEASWPAERSDRQDRTSIP